MRREAPCRRESGEGIYNSDVPVGALEVAEHLGPCMNAEELDAVVLNSCLGPNMLRQVLAPPREPSFADCSHS
jgi:hypothetical protein